MSARILLAHPPTTDDEAMVQRLAIFQNEIQAAYRIEDAEVRAAAVRVAGLRLCRMAIELFTASNTESEAP